MALILARFQALAWDKYAEAWWADFASPRARATRASGVRPSMLTQQRKRRTRRDAQWRKGDTVTSSSRISLQIWKLAKSLTRTLTLKPDKDFTLMSVSGRWWGWDRLGFEWFSLRAIWGRRALILGDWRAPTHQLPGWREPAKEKDGSIDTLLL